MTRIERFHALAQHPMLGKDFKRMTAKEQAECEALMAELASLSDNDFMHQINRWKLDRPEARSPRHGIQWGLMAQSIEIKSNRAARLNKA